MKKILLSASLVIVIISCNNKKETPAENATTEKTDSTTVVSQLNFEQELLYKSKLPDTLSMTAYRSTGIFVGVNQLKDSVKIVIDVEAQKVTGTLTEIQKGKPNDSVFEGILENKMIVPTRGLNKNSVLTISKDNLTLKRGTETIMLIRK